MGWRLGILTCVGIDVPECSCEQGPNEEGTEGDAQYRGQEEAFACVTKEGPMVVSILGPQACPYPVMLALVTGINANSSSASDP